MGAEIHVAFKQDTLLPSWDGLLFAVLADLVDGSRQRMNRRIKIRSHLDDTPGIDAKVFRRVGVVEEFLQRL